MCRIHNIFHVGRESKLNSYLHTYPPSDKKKKQELHFLYDDEKEENS